MDGVSVWRKLNSWWEEECNQSPAQQCVFSSLFLSFVLHVFSSRFLVFSYVVFLHVFMYFIFLSKAESLFKKY